LSESTREEAEAGMQQAISLVDPFDEDEAL
jgi:hypothetical protein